MSFLLISFDIKVISIVGILMEKINQLNVTIQQNQQRDDQLRDELNGSMQYTNQLNETMQIMQTNMANYISSNDFELKAINDTYYVVKTPLVIAVPSSDEIDEHRGEVTEMQCSRYNLLFRRN